MKYILPIQYVNIYLSLNYLEIFMKTPLLDNMNNNNNNSITVQENNSKINQNNQDVAITVNNNKEDPNTVAESQVLPQLNALYALQAQNKKINLMIITVLLKF